MIELPSDFIKAFDMVAASVHENAVAHGWWEGERNDGEMLMLMVTELAEACEYIRHGNPPSDHIPEFSGLEEEFADTIIRIMDCSVARGLRLSEAILAKMKFNSNRAYKHGGKAF